MVGVGEGRVRCALVVWAVALAGSLVTLCPLPASASTIVEPSASPLVVPVAASGLPSAVTVVAGGFSPRSLVYVEQCDGVAPTAPSWSPTVHCDLGSSPSPAIADTRGIATFSSTDRNRAFHPFAGESPQSLFNCLAPAQRAPANDLPSFTDCTLRVSTSNTAVTSDQAFVRVALTTRSATTTTTTTTATDGSTIPRRVAHAKTPKKTSAPNQAAARRSKGNGNSGRGAAGSSSSVAAVSASRRPNVGLLSFADPDLATGYILVLGGVLVTGLTIALRRRDSGSASTVTGTQIVGER